MNTSNYAEFCDPHADQLASQAREAQLTDLATARRLWAQVDHIVTDQAPWVPVLSRRPAAASRHPSGLDQRACMRQLARLAPHLRCAACATAQNRPCLVTNWPQREQVP